MIIKHGLAGLAKYAATETVLDDFNRANENLEANASWTAIADHTAGSAQIVSNQLRFSGAGVFACVEHSATRAGDMWASLEYVSDTYSAGVIASGPAINMTDNGGLFNGYNLQYDPANSQLLIRRYNDGVVNTRATITSITLSPGDVIKLENNAGTLTAYINDVAQSPTGTDTVHTAGKAGIRGFQNTDTITFDNFDSGDV